MFIVYLAGHLGKDPETRFTPSGQKVTTFNLATNHRKGKEEITVWVKITAWGDRFDKLMSYLKKGSAVLVVGRMMPPSSYADKEGRTQISLEVTAEMIEFSPFGKSDRVPGAPSGAAGYVPANSQPEGGGLDSGAFPGGPFYNKPTQPFGMQSANGQALQDGLHDDDALPF